jgi:hypothetical protein
MTWHVGSDALASRILSSPKRSYGYDRKSVEIRISGSAKICKHLPSTQSRLPEPHFLETRLKGISVLLQLALCPFLF